MSETNVSRPWHGAANPLESLHDWMVKELAALESRLKPAPVVHAPVPPPAPQAQEPAIPPPAATHPTPVEHETS